MNTSENLRRDLKLLTSREYADASFIEIHPDNMYFGTATGRRSERIDDYLRFAQTVDRNMEQMASEIASGSFRSSSTSTPRQGGATTGW